MKLFNSILPTRTEMVYFLNFVFAGSADSEMSEEQKKEKLLELRKKEQEIQDILAKKTKELKKICLREAVRNCSVLYDPFFEAPIHLNVLSALLNHTKVSCLNL